MVDDVLIAKTWMSLLGTGGTDYPCSSMSGIVDLKEGSKVWIQNESQTSIVGVSGPTGVMFSWFSIHMLYTED